MVIQCRLMFHASARALSKHGSEAAPAQSQRHVGGCKGRKRMKPRRNAFTATDVDVEGCKQVHRAPCTAWGAAAGARTRAMHWHTQLPRPHPVSLHRITAVALP